MQILLCAVFFHPTVSSSYWSRLNNVINGRGLMVLYYFIGNFGEAMLEQPLPKFPMKGEPAVPAQRYLYATCPLNA